MGSLKLKITVRFVRRPAFMTVNEVVGWQGMSPVSYNLWISIIKARPFEAYSVVFGLPIWRCDNFCLSPMLILYALYVVSLWRNLFEASYQRFICTVLTPQDFFAARFHPPNEFLHWGFGWSLALGPMAFFPEHHFGGDRRCSMAKTPWFQVTRLPRKVPIFLGPQRLGSFQRIFCWAFKNSGCVELQ